MTRDQARAILQNIDLIRHFAEGGDVGHRLINCHGVQVYIQVTRTICLSNLAPDKHCLYVRVKPHLVWNSEAKAYERIPRNWPAKIKESEILTKEAS